MTLELNCTSVEAAPNPRPFYLATIIKDDGSVLKSIAFKQHPLSPSLYFPEENTPPRVYETYERSLSPSLPYSSNTTKEPPQHFTILTPGPKEECLQAACLSAPNYQKIGEMIIKQFPDGSVRIITLHQD